MNKRDVVVEEFQSFISWLYQKNMVENDGTRFGYRTIVGDFVEQRIREIENEFAQYLREKGYYENTSVQNSRRQ